MNADNDSLQEIEASLLRLGSATLGESGALTADPRLRPAWVGAALAGPAYPVACTPGDNLAVHVGVREAPAGSVLVVDVGAVPDRGYWGEVLTMAAEAAGLRGLVIDGGVRDVAALEAHGFPVFSSTIAARGASKDKPGTAGSPAVVGGVVVHQGDWIVGDVDGVTVVPAASLAAVRQAGNARAAREVEIFAALRAGKSTIELLNLDTSPVTVTVTEEGSHSA
jgi:4-hydroxy-4-methyl-2-oxoglutarate aldolase